jgi:hypothetical protein
MNIKTVSVHYGRKVNLGDFNSANIECTIWADVEPTDDLHASMTAMWAMAKENVKAQIVPLKKANGNGGSVNITETFLGLPIIAPTEPAPIGDDHAH